MIDSIQSSVIDFLTHSLLSHSLLVNFDTVCSALLLNRRPTLCDILFRDGTNCTTYSAVSSGTMGCVLEALRGYFMFAIGFLLTARVTTKDESKEECNA